MDNIVMGTLVGLLLTAGIEGFVISSKNKDISILNGEISILEVEKTALIDGILFQNKEIEKNKVDYETNLQEYINKKPDINTVYVNRYITKEINTTRSNCNDVKNILSNIRNIGI
jgi:hypothetical protein